MYDSFFDPKPIGGRNRRGEEYDEQRSWHGSDSDEEADVAAAEGKWDGDVLFDTGEGREGPTGAPLVTRALLIPFDRPLSAWLIAGKGDPSRSLFCRLASRLTCP